MNRFYSSDIVIHDISFIRYHRNLIHLSEFTSERFLISMGLNPEIFQRKKINNKRLNYGSQYSGLYCYCTLHSRSYCFFAYNLRKNG